MSEVHVKGLRELSAAMQELPAKLERNVLRGGLRAGANVIKPVAQSNIQSQSGRLAASLRVGTGTRGGRVTGYVRTRLFYAPFVEFGTQSHTIEPGARRALSIGGLFVASVDHPGARPHPFMRPAFDSQATAAVVAMAEYIKARLATKNGIDTAHIMIEGDEP
jgi:HK97 gp10 family phage protein